MAKLNWSKVRKPGAVYTTLIFKKPKKNKNKNKPSKKINMKKAYNTNIPVYSKVIVTGKTFQHKEKLKAIGFKWDPNGKSWYLLSNNKDVIKILRESLIQYNLSCVIEGKLHG